METNYKYSFVIPHHNSKGLLKRCVASIPNRRDVQIIVVDDNSNLENKPHICDFNRTVEIVCIDAQNTRGAGKARNIGKAMAKGEWLFFADADDYYKEGFLNVIDKEIEPQVDVIYFEVLSNTKGKNRRDLAVNTYYDDYFNKRRNEEDIKYLLFPPWNKVINKRVYELDSVFCDEVPVSNDVFLTFRIAKAAQKVKVISDKLYYVTYNVDSITYKPRSLETELKTIDVRIRINKFLKEETNCHYEHPLFHMKNLKNILKNHGFNGFMRYLCYIHKKDSITKAVYILAKKYLRKVYE